MKLLPATSRSKTEVTIPDANLRTALKAALGISITSPITEADMSRISYLDIREKQIRSLEGIQYAVNMSGLSVSSNPIIDVSALQNLPHLRSLELSHTQVADISILNNLNLRHFVATHTAITDINVLSNWKTLDVVHLADNQISDFTPLTNLPVLRFLNVDHTKLSDLTQLPTIASLRILSIRNNQISDISALTKLTGLTYVAMDNNKISNISSLAQLKDLESIFASGNTISHLTPLKNLTKLIEIHFSNNTIQDINSLTNLTHLNDIQLENNNISDITALSKLTNLTTLHLGTNQIQSIEPLRPIRSLKTLNLNTNQIKDISPLENNKMSHFDATNQKILLPLAQLADGENNWSVNNPVTGKYGETIHPEAISNQGSYNAATNSVTWHGLTDLSGSVNYTFGEGSNTFTGTVTQNYQHVSTGTITPNKFLLGTDKYLEGSYTGDVKKFKITVNGQEYSGGTAENGTFKIYAHGKIKSGTDEVIVYAYDENEVLLDTEKVTITSGSTGTVTPNPYIFGTSKYVTGTYTGDVAKMELNVDGTVYEGGTITDGQINFYAHGKITATSKKINVSVYDKYDVLLDTKPIVVNK
ncbi:hypothetical protein HCA69_05750 [Listeria grandensis]|uniref:Internalin n=1 Tax=Listeria grandensis TaxID=1494963 RepID=A0A7X0Y2V5_9LIST|nr:immunoglobulin-like domain-containing protein [Listeria grandensis]MBC1935863.1 hypothetical protein [Listeria grandensis]